MLGEVAFVILEVLYRNEMNQIQKYFDNFEALEYKDILLYNGCS